MYICKQSDWNFLSLGGNLITDIGTELRIYLTVFIFYSYLYILTYMYVCKYKHMYIHRYTCIQVYLNIYTHIFRCRNAVKFMPNKSKYKKVKYMQ
jgi:hypothetical protein